MSLADEYLEIPDGYASRLGGLRWAGGGDAIDLADGSTFAFSFQVGAFLEGFLTNGKLIHFAFVLQLIGLLRPADGGKAGGKRGVVSQTFQSAGRSHRNAGAFFAKLCADVPVYPGQPVAADLLWRLQYPPQSEIAFDAEATARAPAPPQSPEWFEAHVLRALDAYSADDILHWFRHGTGPLKGVPETVATIISGLVEAIVSRPPTLHAALAALAQNPRLAGAVPFVARFVSALTLPRRTIDRSEMAIGGYDDVSTRGSLGQLLPSQLALETDEFVRRFAERELLYFRREEPHARTRQGLVLLLDQGVRTWGVVRLMLCAATIGFGRYAERSGRGLRVGVTSQPGLVDPLVASPQGLSTLLEASDLSPHPAEALERVLEETAGSGADVVLLTHPRNLGEADVRAAARRQTPGDGRLFALTVSAAGDAELSEVRRGLPVSLTRFRVEADAVAVPSGVVAARNAGRDWSGDVERVPFPFPFGTAAVHGPRRLAFDHAGEWLLLSSGPGLLHAVRTDGSGFEIWPRPALGDSVLAEPEAIVGVAGGFVVAGRIDGKTCLAHFDLATRTTRVHSLTRDDANPRRHWWYERRSHAIVFELHAPSQVHHLNLTTGRCEVRPEPGPGTVPKRHRSRQTIPLRDRSIIPDSNVDGVAAGETRSAPADRPRDGVAWPFVAFDAPAGTVEVFGGTDWTEFTPRNDGRPLLENSILKDADCRGQTLACRFVDFPPGRLTQTLRLFRGFDGVLAAEYPLKGDGFTISADGRLVAFQAEPSRVEVRDVLRRGTARSVSPVGRFHATIRVLLGDTRLTIDNGVAVHRLDWSSAGPFWTFRRNGAGDAGDGTLAIKGVLPVWVTDRRRFVASARRSLVAVVDAFGQVALFDQAGSLVCMVITFRGRLAAWMPDGTRFGPTEGFGGPATPEAGSRIAAALRAAANQAKERSAL